MDIGAYLDEVRKAYDSGHATEHSYRKPLQGLFESINSGLTIINEAKQSEGGMPDFLFLRGDIPFGWAEAKDAPYSYEGEGDDVVGSGYPKWESGKVHINKDQYFADVPKLAWEFHIGGYQPAQKWLKDRRGRVLSYEDVTHYQRIVKILSETDRIMKEIELPLA